MAHIYGSDDTAIMAARRIARQSTHVQRAKMMLAAAGIAAFGIVVVAATMMTTLF
ncbi:hypothetical protein [Devosia sp. 2618]|uniref:hypothetical protein n=1 Tax=Devosia sp. 2618 TaxID=3156454 RepID=UPI003397F5EE